MEPTESSNLLSILDQLHSHTLSDGGVGLLSFDADFFEHDAFGVRGAAEGRGLVGCSEQALLVVQIGPATLFTGGDEFAGGVQTAGFPSICHF